LVFLQIIRSTCLRIRFIFFLLILFAIFDPTTIFKGIIFKGIIISFLFYAIKTAREEQALNKESKADLLDQL